MDAVKNVVDETTKNVVETTQGVTTAVVETTKKGFDVTVDAAGKAKNVVDETTKNVVETTQGVTTAVVETTKKGFDVTVDAAGKAGEASTKFGKDVFDQTSAAGAMMMGGINGVFDQLGVSAGFQAVMMGFNGTVDTTDSGLEKLFKEIDTSGDGFLSDQEMIDAIAKIYGDAVDAALIAEMMTAADSNKDGKISLDEFKVIMRSGPKDAPKPKGDAPDSPSYQVKRSRKGEVQVKLVDDKKGGCMVM